MKRIHGKNANASDPLLRKRFPLFRKLIASVAFLITLIASSAIGFIFPDSIFMIYQGGLELFYQQWILWEGPYEYLSIWISIFGMGCGGVFGWMLWEWGIVRIGILNKEEFNELAWAINEWGLFGALKKPPPKT